MSYKSVFQELVGPAVILILEWDTCNIIQSCKVNSDFFKRKGIQFQKIPYASTSPFMVTPFRIENYQMCRIFIFLFMSTYSVF